MTLTSKAKLGEQSESISNESAQVKKIDKPSYSKFKTSTPGNPKNVPESIDQVSQKDLVGNSKARGRQSLAKPEINMSKKLKFLISESKVFAILKVNGQEFNIASNGKAGDELIFHFVGKQNQDGIKKNFHAEDWVLNSFKWDYQAYKKDKVKNKAEAAEGSGEGYIKEDKKEDIVSLHKYLKDNFLSNENNKGVDGKHVFSLKINYSSCHGCVETIKGFKNI